MQRSWVLSVLGTALFFVVVIQIPQWIYSLDPRSEGVLVHLNSDEDVYLARVEEALMGRWSQSAEAIIGDPALRGSQPALLERVIGTVFAPIGWRAAEVLQLMDSVTIFLLFLSLFWFFRQSGFSQAQALSGTTVFSLIELYNLNRPIHQGLSFVLLLSAFNFLILGLEKKRAWGFAGALFLGLLFGDYFWSWSFGWLWAVLLLAAEYVEKSSSRTQHLLRFFAVALAAALPFLWQLASMFRDPLYADAKFRSGIHFSHLPESYPYSILFFVMTFGVFASLWMQPEKIRRYRYAILLVVTALIAMHQQLVHGMVFNFVSHYLFPMIAAAIGVVLLAWAVRSLPLKIAAGAAIIYLAAVAYDGRFVIDQFRIIDRFDEQHYASALPVLDALPRATILSDPQTSMFLAGSTQHDVVYSLYLKNVLMSHEAIAERYCVTQLPLKPDDRRFSKEMLVWPDANGAFRENSLRIREIAMVEDECMTLDRNAAAALKRYGVTYVFWDEKRQPDWNLHRLHVQLKKVGGGSGWSLWKVTSR